MKYFDFLRLKRIPSNVFKFILVVLFVPAMLGAVLARPGDLDRTFGTGGKVIQHWGPGENSFHDVLQLPDGKALVLAKDRAFNVILARYNPDGTRDTTFDGDGFAIHGMGAISYAAKMALQPDGKILVAGSSRQTSPQDDVMLLRFNSDGTLDNTFNGNGKFFRNLSQGRDVAIDIDLQPDGRIVIAGYMNADTSDATDLFLMRFNTNGTLDPDFDADGMVFTSTPADAIDLASSLKILPDGKMIVLGSMRPNQPPLPQYLLFAKYNANGSLDTDFGAGGLKTHYLGDEIYPTPSEMLVQPDGKIVACVNLWFTEVSTLMRFMPDGSFDTGFGNNGRVAFGDYGNYLYDVILEPDQKLLTVGVRSLDLMVARVDKNGVPDPSFGDNGITLTTVPGGGTEYAWAADLQKNGRLLVAGDFSLSLFDYDAVLLRFHAFQNSPFDFDGDGKADVSVFRPSEGNWYVQNSADLNVTGLHFGQAGDLLTPGDFDGDGKTDISVFRPTEGNWYRLNSKDGTFSGIHFGAAEDKPAVGDFDGDAKADVSVFRPSEGTWYRLNSENGSFASVRFGVAEDKPTVGDFDGDGRADISLYRPSEGNWYRLNSYDGSFTGLHFGISEDKPTVGDFDGDGKADIAVFRPLEGNWYRLNSNNGSFFGTHFGLTGDKPVAADFDGDGIADIAVFRPSDGNWYILNSTAGFTAQHFGAAEDIPTPNSFVY